MSLQAYTTRVTVPAKVVKLHVPLVPTRSVQWRIPANLPANKSPMLRMSATAGNTLDTSEIDGWTFEDIELEEFSGFWVDNPSDEDVEIVFSGSPGRQSIDRNGILNLLDSINNGLTVEDVTVANFEDLGTVTLTVQPRQVTRATSTGAIVHKVDQGETVRQILDVSAKPNVKSVLIQVANLMDDGTTAAGDVILSGSDSASPIVPEIVIPAGSVYEITDEVRDLWAHNLTNTHYWVTVKEF